MTFERQKTVSLNIRLKNESIFSVSYGTHSGPDTEFDSRHRTCPCRGFGGLT